jgi:hypothetical protein
VWASVWTSYPPAAHATSPSWSWTSDVRKVPVGMSRLVELSLIGCGHLQLGFLPPSSSEIVQAVTEHRRSRIPDHLPSCECSICRGEPSWTGSLCSHTLRVLDLAFSEILNLPDLPTVAGSTSLQTWWQTGWAGGRTGTPAVWCLNECSLNHPCSSARRQ